MIIRQFEPNDIPKIQAFFDQMGAETTKFFNTNDVNRKNGIPVLRSAPIWRVALHQTLPLLY